MNQDSEKSAEHLISDLRSTILSFDHSDKRRNTSLFKYSFIGLLIFTAIFFLGFYIAKKINSPEHKSVKSIRSSSSKGL
ncbi:hypothetical protein [Pedobacter sp. MR2016-24]|uniref:hypothetical protein n=1 Tax=Pedobacter sp. MR2016-24 TaxID=2994466 RepID=UPI002246EA1D|nr:hypothetical protein [Pedobacter sp. MR2016-24]MCX2485453.1 hypothetical protein [Pedobacter sp. MR2016-24]